MRGKKAEAFFPIHSFVSSVFGCVVSQLASSLLLYVLTQKGGLNGSYGNEAYGIRTSHKKT